MRLTDRDRRIIEAVYSYDGILTDNQIRRLFRIGRTQAQLRLKLLYQHGYLNRPDRRRRWMLPFTVYWLGRGGAAYIAGLEGKDLRGFTWRQEPRWITIEHDVAVNDLRIAVVTACEHEPRVTLSEWMGQDEFWSQPDKVTYTQGGKALSRAIRPDGYCLLTTERTRLRFLWEIDRRTEDNPRWVREKVYPYLAYLKSDAYFARFGQRSGRILTVTTGQKRLDNMKTRTERTIGDKARLFAFTTFEQVKAYPILTAPIWYWGGEDTPKPLLFR
jgi:hypothetical protein